MKREAKPKILTRKRIVGTCVAVALVCVTLLVYRERSPKQPEYRGRSLSYWLGELRPTIAHQLPDGSVSYMDAGAFTIHGRRFGPTDYDFTSREPTEALLSIGTNAFPFLLHELQQTDSKAQLLVGKIATQLRFSGPRTWLPSAEGRRAQALTAFRILGTNASAVLLELQKLTKRREATIRYSSQLVLTGLSTNAPTSWFNPP